MSEVKPVGAKVNESGNTGVPKVFVDESLDWQAEMQIVTAQAQAMAEQAQQELTVAQQRILAQFQPRLGENEQLFWARMRAVQAKNGRAVVGLVTGCFDILHQGHMMMLRQAQKKCDHLIVAIETDKRVRQAKGKRRPLFSQEERQRRLEKALNNCTQVEILPPHFEDERVRLEWLRDHGIDLLFTTKYDPFLKNKQILMMMVGGRVEFVARQMQTSTTQLLEGRRRPHDLVFPEDEAVIDEYRKQREQTE